MPWSKFLFLFLNVICVESQAVGAKSKETTEVVKEKEVIYSGRQNEEWVQVQAQITILKGRLENQRKTVEALIEKKTESSGAQQQALIEELKKAHIQWSNSIQQYNELSTTFQNKYPEKGGSVGRIYKRMEPSNIESLEQKMTLEGRLQKLNKKIKKQYSKTPVEVDSEVDKKIKKTTETATSQENPVKKTTEIQVTDQIILQK